MSNAFMVRFTMEGSWTDNREEKNMGKCAVIGEGVEKYRQYARILSYRRVWKTI